MVVQSHCLASKTVQDGLYIRPKTVDDLLKTGTHGPGLPQDSSQQVYMSTPTQDNPKQIQDKTMTRPRPSRKWFANIILTFWFPKQSRKSQNCPRQPEDHPRQTFDSPEQSRDGPKHTRVDPRQTKENQITANGLYKTRSRNANLSIQSLGAFVDTSCYCYLYIPV